MLPFRSGRSALRGWLVWLFSIALSVLILSPPVSAQPKGRKKKGRGGALPSPSPGEQSLTNIPLPIGHEAKGLVLPDFDSDGHLRGKFEAGTARRIDEEHVQFNALKITTYTPEARPDLTIVMNQCIFDLKTRILSSNEHTTVTRSEEHTSELQSHSFISYAV